MPETTLNLFNTNSRRLEDLPMTHVLVTRCQERFAEAITPSKAGRESLFRRVVGFQIYVLALSSLTSVGFDRVTGT